MMDLRCSGSAVHVHLKSGIYLSLLAGPSPLPRFTAFETVARHATACYITVGSMDETPIHPLVTEAKRLQ
ncbi:MAG: hypothetical protein P8M79_13230 [Alphaproteobacteria bacterium]|nr:hypothetical protein [Alphaproteobacteria bacterium]